MCWYGLDIWFYIALRWSPVVFIFVTNIHRIYWLGIEVRILSTSNVFSLFSEFSSVGLFFVFHSSFQSNGCRVLRAKVNFSQMQCLEWSHVPLTCLELSYKLLSNFTVGNLLSRRLVAFLCKETSCITNAFCYKLWWVTHWDFTTGYPKSTCSLYRSTWRTINLGHFPGKLSSSPGQTSLQGHKLPVT